MFSVHSSILCGVKAQKATLNVALVKCFLNFQL